MLLRSNENSGQSRKMLRLRYNVISTFYLKIDLVRFLRDEKCFAVDMFYLDCIMSFRNISPFPL